MSSTLSPTPRTTRSLLVLSWFMAFHTHQVHLSVLGKSFIRSFTDPHFSIFFIFLASRFHNAAIDYINASFSYCSIHLFSFVGIRTLQVSKVGTKRHLSAKYLSITLEEKHITFKCHSGQSLAKRLTWYFSDEFPAK